MFAITVYIIVSLLRVKIVNMTGKSVETNGIYKSIQKLIIKLKLRENSNASL